MREEPPIAKPFSGVELALELQLEVARGLLCPLAKPVLRTLTEGDIYIMTHSIFRGTRGIGGGEGVTCQYIRFYGFPLRRRGTVYEIHGGVSPAKRRRVTRLTRESFTSVSFSTVT